MTKKEKNALLDRAMQLRRTPEQMESMIDLYPANKTFAVYQHELSQFLLDIAVIFIREG